MKSRFCSLCLATEVRVFEFINSEAKCFIENTFKENGWNRFHQSMYHQYICYECQALLIKTYQFVKKALAAQQIICNLYKDVNEINVQHLKTISRTKLNLDTNLTTHELYNIECIARGDKKAIAKVNENNCEPALKDEHQEDEIEIGIVNFNVADPLDEIEIKYDSEIIKEESGAVSDNSLNDLHYCEEIPIVGPKSESKGIEILKTCDESIRTGSNKSFIEADTNDIISPKLYKNTKRKSKKQSEDLKPVKDHAINKKDTDPDYTKSPKKEKKKKKQPIKKYEKKKTPFQPSEFMLSLSSYAEKKRKRNIKKYVNSDDSDNSPVKHEPDQEYEPNSSSDSFDEKEEMVYVSDKGRRRMKSPDLREYPMKCDHCDEEIPQKKVHYIHYLMYHPKTEYPYATKKSWNLCQFCGHASSNTNLHVAHLLTHGSERAFVCRKCPKRFKNMIRLRTHIRRVHTDKYLECNYCGKRFKTREDIRRHLRIHTGEKPFKCHICGAGFAHKGNVGIHIRSNHQGQRQQSTKKKKENERKRRICSTIEEEDEPLIVMKKRKTTKAKKEKAKKKIKPNKC